MNKKSSKQAIKNKGVTLATIAVIVLLVVVVVLGLLFMQSPEKQIASGFANLVDTKTLGVDGSVTSASSNVKTQISIAGVTDKRVADSRVLFSLQAGAAEKFGTKAQVIVADDGTPYAKVDDPRQLITAYGKFVLGVIPVTSLKGLDATQRKAVEDGIAKNSALLADKLGNKWIKLDSNSLAAGGGTGDLGCYVSFARKLEEDAGARKQLSGAFKKSQFFTVGKKLDRDGAAQGYRVGIDQAKIKDFKDSVADNAAVKSLGSCGTDILTFGATDNINDQTADIWVDRLSSRITRIKYTKQQSEGSTVAVDIKFSYDKSVQVVTPTDVVSMKELISGGLPQDSSRPADQ